MLWLRCLCLFPQFLYLHLQSMSDRSQWEELVLSSLRSLPNPAQYREFSVENPRDLQQCWNFFHHSLKESRGQPGGNQFLAILVKILQKDFEVWWKHWRRRRGTSTSWPLLYYCLGGGAGQPERHLQHDS